MRTDDLIEAFRTNALFIDCVEMTLTQRGADEPLIFKGKGFIRQDERGRTIFRLYTTSDDVDQATYYFDVAHTEPGALLGEEKYFDLRATDKLNGTWIADRLSINPTWPVAGPPIIGGELDELETERVWQPTRCTLKMLLFEDLKFPTNRGRALINQPISSTFNALGYKFDVYQAPDRATLTVESDTPIPHDLPTRIHETLMFVTAKAANIRVLIKEENLSQYLTFRAPPATTRPLQAFPPLDVNDYCFPDAGPKLFEKYLAFLRKSAFSGYWHHVTYFVQNASEASIASLDSWAVSTSVGVEGLASLIDAIGVDAHRRRVTELRKWVNEKLEREERFSPLRDRLSGLFGMMNDTRVKDRLGPLIATGHISGDYLKAWQKLRNRQAHPKQEDLADATVNDMDRRFTLLRQTTTLMYQIVFYIIGYEGPFSDYGEQRYPVTQYPLPPPIPKDAWDKSALLNWSPFRRNFTRRER